MYYGPIALIALGIAVWLNTKWGERWLDGEEEEEG
jgi:hypothetical protein